jgi:hypothetical protein
LWKAIVAVRGEGLKGKGKKKLWQFVFWVIEFRGWLSIGLAELLWVVGRLRRNFTWFVRINLLALFLQAGFKYLESSSNCAGNYQVVQTHYNLKYLSGLSGAR